MPYDLNRRSWHKHRVVVNDDDRDALARILLLIRVLEQIDFVAVVKVKHDILKGGPSLAQERLVLRLIPVADLQVATLPQRVPLVISAY